MLLFLLGMVSGATIGVIMMSSMSLAKEADEAFTRSLSHHGCHHGYCTAFLAIGKCLREMLPNLGNQLRPRSAQIAPGNSAATYGRF